MRKKYTLIIVALLIAGGGYFWYSQTHQGNAQVQYITEAVQKSTLTKSITASGNVVVDQQATVDPTITGTVADLAVSVGDSVKEGQFLFNIINDDLDVNVASAKTSYLKAQNSIASAKLSVKDAEATYYAVKSDEDKSRKQKDVLKTKISVAEDDLALANQEASASFISYQNVLSNANDRKVVSPIDGTVNEINIENGYDLSNNSSSSSNSDSPIIIGDLTTLKASVSVNEVDITNVSVGQKVSLKFDAIDSLEATGEVETIDSLGSESSGVVTYTITIKFDSLDARIMPKMSVTATIISESKEDVIAVPTSAIQSMGSNNYVQVLNSGSVPEKKAVQIGISNDLSTEITSGLSVGDKIVTQTIAVSSTDSSSDSKSSSSVSTSSVMSGLSGGSGGGPPAGGGPPQ